MNFKQALLSGNFADQVNEAIHGEQILNERTLYNVLKPLMAEHPGVESFYVLFLTAKNKVIKIERMFSGTLAQCSVYPREIIKKALEHNAASIILAHNHPSGDPMASNIDLSITQKIAGACHVVGITLHEHLIVGNETYSMATTGFIDEFNQKAKEFFT